MRLIIGSAFAFVLAVLHCGVVMASGGYCEIPELVQGHPTDVHVGDIDQGLCGAARIGNRIVRIDQVAAHKSVGPVQCINGRAECWRRVEYYLSDSDSLPYIVILRGPRAG